MTTFQCMKGPKDQIMRATMAALLSAVVLATVGCAAFPWSNCDPCVEPCAVPPDCFGYYPTCWRPWPCPDLCPIWEPDAETIPEPDGPAPEIPFDDQSHAPPIPTVDPVLQETARLQYLPETVPEPVIQAGWPSGEESESLDARTPFSSRALSTALYFAQ